MDRYEPNPKIEKEWRTWVDRSNTDVGLWAPADRRVVRQAFDAAYQLGQRHGIALARDILTRAITMKQESP